MSNSIPGPGYTYYSTSGLMPGTGDVLDELGPAGEFQRPGYVGNRVAHKPF